MIHSNQKQRPIAVDLFAGAGGMTLGFEQAGFDVLASVEIDPIHCATHEFNFPFWTIFSKSVVDLTEVEIRRNSSIGDREIDVVFGGSPCQGFSLIGKRIFDDPRNSLVKNFIHLVLELQPKFFVLENVKGITLGKHREFLSVIINEFEQSGYKVSKDYKVLNAAEYGVPQNRERLFLLGCRQDLELPNYPAALTRPAKLNKTAFQNQLPLSPTVFDAIGDLPEVEDYIELFEKDSVIAEFGKPSDYSRQLRGLCYTDNDYSYERKYDSRMLTSSLRTKHTFQSIKRFEATLPGKTEPISRFYKLAPEGICNTLRAGTPRNRGAFTSARPIHPFTSRCITVREAARLHSYPDWFRFHVTKLHGFRQIGNSVPPLLAKAVASEIIKVLGVCPYKPGVIQELGNENLLMYDMSKAAEHYGVDSRIIELRKRN
ncbi:DNA (cytosine-5-)-methyltransferase [Brasilonema octagenarum UFV-E1]|uniref:Cytosine-specific methyltransferase n=1 Tax=Brasilonema sennae CENA114 TaxID=415709 RepID=A0A856MFL4_9CYAN|nr:DNA cytosine methyltransferase [Brasilonema sennae]QDL09040.1 DNA (cytosine-5-)-methyltransferase [Brasilonema sennae CENA114]QDL15397.1 DNA (cytosine-5-)-methyltransferase [Brasilonema octagenarum UFV-E1]